jgi:hypothetical protein
MGRSPSVWIGVATTYLHPKDVATLVFQLKTHVKH